MPPQFTHWRLPNSDSYKISPEGHPNTLRLKPSALNLTGLDGNSGGLGGQSFVGRRQVDTFFNYYVDMDFTPTTLEEEAGITLFLTQNHHARLGVAMLPTSNSSTQLTPHFRFKAESYIPVPASFAVPVPVEWQNKILTMALTTVNITHYAFRAGPADKSVAMETLAYVPGSIVSWGFTGTLVGVYATTNGRNGTTLTPTPAYFSNWTYEGWGQVRDQWNSTYRM